MTERTRADAFEDGKLGEAIVLELLRQKYPGTPIQDVRDDPVQRQRDIDFILTMPDGKFTIEAKGDSHTRRTGNIALEFRRRYVDGPGPGCWLRSEADEWWYVALDRNGKLPPGATPRHQLYVLDARLLRGHFTLGFLGRQGYTVQPNKRKDDPTIYDCYLVPISDFPASSFYGPADIIIELK